MLLLYHIRKGNALTPNSPFTFHYASTLSGVEAPSALTAKIFTFHYASTLSIKTGYRRRAISNLHSTMLLLYLCPDLGWREWMHLHSTMLLLYQRRTSKQEGQNYYLHSTMLLLYHFLWSITILCHLYLHSTMLLLYPCPFFFDSLTVTDLHSTMLLLYLSVLKGCLLVIIIYIPLCFYFIEVSRFYRKKSNLIYIPLCFYFIAFTTTKSASTL